MYKAQSMFTDLLSGARDIHKYIITIERWAPQEDNGNADFLGMIFELSLNIEGRGGKEEE